MTKQWGPVTTELSAQARECFTEVWDALWSDSNEDLTLGELLTSAEAKYGDETIEEIRQWIRGLRGN